MKNLISYFAKASAILSALIFLIGQSYAGGLVELDGVFDSDSNIITNSWWPLSEGATMVYFAEGDDECIVDIVHVLSTTKVVNGVNVREVSDKEFLDEDCNMTGDELLEETLDWYAQDVSGNVWYFGEFTISYDWDECDNPDGFGGCLDGGWEAGKDIVNVGTIAEEGIIMLAEPGKGDFYFQEFYEDVATDMGKVLNFKKVDTVLYGKLKGCLMIKEWVPLDPGSIEHKYYCEDKGLVLVEENAGGKTVFVDLVINATP